MRQVWILPQIFDVKKELEKITYLWFFPSNEHFLRQIFSTKITEITKLRRKIVTILG